MLGWEEGLIAFWTHGPKLLIYIYIYTWLKTNMDPEHHWFVEERRLSGSHSQGPC